MRTLAKLGLLALTSGTLALGSAARSHRPAPAAPRPDCGPTRHWICVLPGCPDCPVVLFEGTVCEKAAFEKTSRRKCSSDGV
jgi:hypothetical protein